MALENKKPLAPVFIIGVEHSGTTILYRMLAQHLDFAWFSQYSLRNGLIPGRTKILLGDCINRIGRKVKPPVWQKGFRGLSKIFPTPMEPHQIWNFLLPDSKQFFVPEDCSADMRTRVYNACSQELQSWRKRQLLIKLPRLSRAVLLLNAVFPDAFFIHIIRDGKAVALSNRAKFSRSPYGAATSLQQSCEYWKNVIEYLLHAQELIGDKRFLLITYEDFCRNVHMRLEQICAFCRLHYAKDIFQHIPAELSITNSIWYETCTAEDKTAINESIGGLLHRLNYELFEV